MRHWWLGVPFLLPFVNCSSSAPPVSPLNGTYVAASAGTYTQIVFDGSSHYTLTLSQCGGSVACTESGTFEVNAAETQITLTDGTTGKDTVLPYQAIETTAGGDDSLSTDSVHLLGTSLTSSGTSLTSALTKLVQALTIGSQYLGLSQPVSLTQQMLGPNPSGNAAQYPFIFEHGWASSNAHNTLSPAVLSALQADGNTVQLADVSPFGSIETRGSQLLGEIQALLAQTGAKKVNIIAHSMGGLDARYVVSPQGLAAGDLVASITTISTPHRGSRFADVSLKYLTGANEPVWLSNVVNSVLGDLGDFYAGKEGSSHPTSSQVILSLQQISVAGTQSFNQKYQDDPNVQYFSWTGVSSRTGTLTSAAQAACAAGANPQGNLLANGVTFSTEIPLLLTEYYTGSEDLGAEQPNDSMVAIASGIYGTFEGCFPGDHMTELGQKFTGVISGAVPTTGWDPVRFYRNWVFELAAMGF